MLPVMRDPDGFIYYKEEVGGLLMGGFEPKAKPWTVDPIPSTFQFELLGEDWEQFEPLMTNAMHRTPCLETARIKMLLNGPESFTPDGNFILGEAPELRNYFVARRLQLGRHRQLGRRRQADGRMDRRRRGAQRLVGRGHSPLCRLHRQPKGAGAAHRRNAGPALRDALAAAGAGIGAAAAHLAAVRPAQGQGRGVRQQERLGACQLLSPRADTPRPPYGLGKPGWLGWMIEEQRATRDAVALYDQSSFSKLQLQGRDALAVLQRLCANDIDMPVDKMVYTALLNERGGFESDLTIIRTAPNTYLIVTGSAQTTRDFDWISRHIEPHEHAMLSDVSAMYSVLSLMGPRSRELLARVSPDDLSPAALKFSHTRDHRPGPGAGARRAHELCRRARLRAVCAGGDGAPCVPGADGSRRRSGLAGWTRPLLGLADAGYYALDALRIEAGRRAWGAELGPDETPFEAGLSYAVKLDKAHDFIGRAALLAAQGRPLRKKLLSFVFDDPKAWAWGGEAIVVDGQAVGELSSVGWSPKAGVCIGLGYVRGAAAVQEHKGTPVHLDLWGEPVGARAWDHWPPR